MVVNRDSKTGLNYLSIKGNEAQGVSVIITSDKDIETLNKLADEFQKYPVSSQRSTAGLYALLEISGNLKCEKDGFTFLTPNGITYIPYDGDSSKAWEIDMPGSCYAIARKCLAAENDCAGSKDICFSIVRYGNVAGSRGSVIPFFHNIIKNGGTELPITDYRMTRFWISLQQGVELVIKALEESKGGETFISKIPSFKITDLAQAMLPGCEMPEVGIREGEKLHEIMVTVEDSMNTYEYDKHFIVYPQMVWSESRRAVPTGKRVAEGFSYSSGNNTEWLSVEQIRELLKTIDLEK